MKYWMGKENTDKDGQFGTMDNNGRVPNTITISKYKWDKLTAESPVIEYEESDIEKLVKWAKKEGHLS